MKAEPGLERCLAYINCEITPPPQRDLKGPHYRTVTISRETGSGGHAVAEKLAEILRQHAPVEACPWTVFDRNLVERVLEDHHLPSRLAKFMPEDRISEISDTMDELFGLHPPSWSLVRDVSDTILRLAERGNVIIIGRAGNVITAKMDHVFHVRLIGSMEHRLQRLQETDGLGRKAALQRLRQEDRGRERYVAKYFGRDVNDPVSYHALINTDWVSPTNAAKMIASVVLMDKPLIAEMASLPR